MIKAIEYLYKEIEKLQNEILELDNKGCENCGYRTEDQINSVRKEQELNILILQITEIIKEYDE